MHIQPIVSFKGKPNNYTKIDEFVSRSAQPKAEDFAWLKKRNVTDVINFRTMHVSGLDFDEKTIVEKNGMKYHNIPSVTTKPQKENIQKFLDITENVKKSGGKVHIHCKAGADRTGMYSLIYKQLNKIGEFYENVAEMLKFGHNAKRYPNLIGWVEHFLKHYKP